MKSVEKDIAIVGGGPVGLYLAARFLQQGFTCAILEKNKTINPHSKSIGIHPVSLELFNKAGMAEPFLEQGLKIRKGAAFWNKTKAGEVSFEKCPMPYNFVLALHQWKTEKVLQDWVCSLDEASMMRNTEATAIHQTNDFVDIICRQNIETFTVRAKFAVGCDGKNSFVRRAVNISYDEKIYPDTYIMGDFSDNTNFGPDAAIFLHKEGLIEAFPLPGGQRRWVVKTDSRVDHPQRRNLVKMVENRIGHSLSETENFMLSSFGVQHFLADVLHSGRVLLAGDSAHVVSPIGGQGMNLGWIGAEFCFITLKKALRYSNMYEKLFEVYSEKQKKIARQAARRAEMNMWLGRSENSGSVVEIAARVLLGTPLSHILARVFTMRGLGKWWY